MGEEEVAPERTIGASYGDAFMAGLATGIVPEIEALQRDWVSLSLRLEPNPALQPVYDEYYAVYRGLYESAKEQLHTLARLGASNSES